MLHAKQGSGWSERLTCYCFGYFDRVTLVCNSYSHLEQRVIWGERVTCYSLWHSQCLGLPSNWVPSISYATEIQYRGQYDRVECYSFCHSVFGYSSLMVSMFNVHLCTISAGATAILICKRWEYHGLQHIVFDHYICTALYMFLLSKDWWVVGSPCFSDIHRSKVKRWELSPVLCFWFPRQKIHLCQNAYSTQSAHPGPFQHKGAREE